MTDQPPEDQPPTREERLVLLADKLCRSYTYGVGIDETAQTDPAQAEAHQDAAARQLGLSNKHMNQMLTGRATLTLDWADRIAALCGMRIVVLALTGRSDDDPDAPAGNEA